MTNITVIIVTYNSSAVIERALLSVSGMDCYVVDNASSDNTVEIVREKFPSVNIIENKENLGFGNGNNAALEKVSTKYALLLNPDAVMEKNSVSELVEASKRYSNAAVLAPVLVFENGDYQKVYKRNVFHREKVKYPYHNPDGDVSAEFIVAAVWLMKMEYVKKIRFFDPKIFLFYEDDDMCLRLRNAGYDLVVVPSATAIHLLGKSSLPNHKAEFVKQKNMVWSRLYMEKKYHGKAEYLAVKLLLKYMAKTLGYGMLLRHKKIQRYSARCAGIIAFLKAN